MTVYDKTIAEMDGLSYSEFGLDSYVVKTARDSVNKPINALSLEEIRLLISQNIGVRYLLPIALNELEKDPLVEVTFYEGDLLSAVLRLPDDLWDDLPDEYERIRGIIRKNHERLKDSDDIDISKMIQK